MKKQIIAIFSLIALLAGCTPSTSSSLSSNPSTGPSDSQGSSDSSSTQPGDLIKQVAAGVKKYDGGLSEAELAAKASIPINARCTYGNLLLLLKAAFGETMPALTGFRKYSGVYTLPS